MLAVKLFGLLQSFHFHGERGQLAASSTEMEMSRSDEYNLSLYIVLVT